MVRYLFYTCLVSLRPELNIGETISHVPKRLAGEIVLSLALNQRRDLAADAKHFHEAYQIPVFNKEHLSGWDKHPAFLVFNHPKTNVLFEGIFTLTNALSEAGKKDFIIVAAAEIPDKSGGYSQMSVRFMERLAAVYHPHILLLPNLPKNPNYRTGRDQAVKTINLLLSLGHAVGLAAEGTWGEKENSTLPDGGVRYGAGQIAIDTYKKYHGQVLPVGFAVDHRGKTYIEIGKPLVPRSANKKEVALQIAGAIKDLLPAKMVVR